MGLFIKILFYVLLGSLLLRVLLRVIVELRAEQIMKSMNTKKVQMLDAFALCVGSHAKQNNQKKGRGLLLLSDNILFFETWIPRYKLKIPVNALVKVEVEQQKFGSRVVKEYFSVALKVSTDSLEYMKWEVKNPSHWEQLVNRVLETIKK